MNAPLKKSAPLTKQELLAGRRFEELSESEKQTYGILHRQQGEALGQRIVDNLNRNVMARGR